MANGSIKASARWAIFKNAVWLVSALILSTVPAQFKNSTPVSYNKPALTNMTYLRLINHQINKGPPLPDAQVLALWTGKAVQALIVALAYIAALVLCVLAATTVVLLLVFLYVGPETFRFLLPFDLGGSYSYSVPPADMWVTFEVDVLGNSDSGNKSTLGDVDVKVDDPKESTNLLVPPAIVNVDPKPIVPPVAVPQPQPIQSPPSSIPLQVSKSQGQAQSLAKFLEETKAYIPVHSAFTRAPAALPLKLALKPTGLVGNTRGIRVQFIPASPPPPSSSSSFTSTPHSNSGFTLDTDVVLWASGTTTPLYRIRHSPMGHPNLRVHGKGDFARDEHLQTLSNFQEDFPQGYFRVDLQVVRDGCSPNSSSGVSLALCSSSSSWYPQTEAQTGTGTLSTMEYCTLTDMFQILSPGMPKPAGPDALYLWRRFEDFVKMPMSALVPGASKAKRGRKVRGPEPAPVQVRVKEEQENEDGWDSGVEIEGGLKPKKKCRRGARGGRRHRRQFQDIILRQANSESPLQQGGSNFNGDPDFSATIRIPIAQDDDDGDRKFTLEISLGGSSSAGGNLDSEHGYGEEGEGGWGENGVIDEAMLEAEWMQECVYAAWLIFVGLVKVDSAELDLALSQ